MAKQTSFFPPQNKAHGGSLSVGRRRASRPLTTRQPLHLTLRSEFATGSRSLLRHKALVDYVLKKAQRLYRIKVYEFAVCGNHLHCLVQGQTRIELQNFFRVFAGHLAQAILSVCPLTPAEETTLAATQTGCRKNRRRFWALLIYSRIVTWGQEFVRVQKYIAQNTLEALFLIAYQPRGRPREGPTAKT